MENFKIEMEMKRNDLIGQIEAFNKNAALLGIEPIQNETKKLEKIFEYVRGTYFDIGYILSSEKYNKVTVYAYKKDNILALIKNDDPDASFFDHDWYIEIDVAE